MKPDPSEVTLRERSCFCCLSKKSLKNSSNGEPGGNWGISTPGRWPLIVWVVDMLTTAGSSFSTRSAKLSDEIFASAPPAGSSAKKATKITSQMLARPLASRRPAPTPASAKPSFPNVTDLSVALGRPPSTEPTCPQYDPIAHVRKVLDASRTPIKP